MELDLKGWDINLENFPPQKDVWDEGRYVLFESKDDIYAFLLYGFIEEGFGKIVCQLAIFINKKYPKILFESEFKFRQVFKHDFIFAEKSVVAILVRHCYDPGKNISDDTFCLLDLKKCKFSILTFELCSFYSLMEMEAGKLQIVLALPADLKRYERRENKIFKKFEGVNVSLSRLIWKDLYDFKNYNSIYCDSPILFTII